MGTLFQSPTGYTPSMPSTGFYRPGPLSRAQLESLVHQAALEHGLEVHITGWQGESLLLVFVDAPAGPVESYRQRVADLVVALIENGTKGVH